MPTKTWEDPRVQEDHRRRQAAHGTDQPRSFDPPANVDDANADTSPRTELDDDINTHGSER
jgi:hypothetical protein